MKRAIILTLALIVAALTTSSARDAKEIFDKECAKCHGKDGKGETKTGRKLDIKDFTDASYQAKLKEGEMAKAIVEGLKVDNRVKMKPVQGLTDQEVKELVAFVRTFKK